MLAGFIGADIVLMIGIQSLGMLLMLFLAFLKPVLKRHNLQTFATRRLGVCWTFSADQWLVACSRVSLKSVKKVKNPFITQD